MACHVRLSVVLILLLRLYGVAGTGVSDANDCQRTCQKGSPPKICFYQFRIELAQRKRGNVTESKKNVFLSVNKKWPPPLISVCENDTIVVEVKNRLPLGIQTSLHWHGLSEGNPPFVDGVPMITQCPIYPHVAFTYRLNAVKPGTFLYRSHYGSQQVDGLFGPVIVRGEKDNQGQIIIVSPISKNLQTMNDGYTANAEIIALEFAVYNDFAVHYDDETKPFRVRIINAAGLNCPVTLTTSTEPVTLLSMDGNKIKPKTLNEITVYPGERIDILTTTKTMRTMQVRGLEICESHVKRGLDAGLSEYQKPGADDGQTAESLTDRPEKIDYGAEAEMAVNLRQSDLNVFLPYDVTVLNEFQGKFDFRYKLGEITAYAPPFLANSPSMFYQTYNKTFLYPSSPLLSQPNDVPDDIICGLKEPSRKCLSDDNAYCECLGIINLPYNKSVDLFIIDEGWNSNSSQTIHLHGYSFQVLGYGSYQRPITAAMVEEEERRKGIPRNLVSPVRKDTVVVPNKGFVILRLKTVNKGTWLIESTTSKARFPTGFEFVLQVDWPCVDADPPKNFPKCGTLKEPDLVIND